ncbi:hypothetical protein K438DRAFT_1809582 [Mycena galopus ATCC 62051]|nr:hypothetical protein K438DRAFT_1809582 [Mycena galopus ATCC 62051]
MASIKDNRPGFGRRNNDDSSSSRESSPVRKQKRSFSPTSDDEIVVEPVGEDDTPPPEGPLLRAAVAFPWTPSIPTAPTSINMYQASPLPAPSIFLPGQAVQAPPPPPPKPRKAKKKTAPRYTSQTGRFRVTSYDPTPPVEPALTSGDGPYASMYRANAASEPSEGTPSGSKKKLTKPSDSRPKASTSKAKVTASNAKSSVSKGKTSGPKQGSTSTPGPSNMAPQPTIQPDAELSLGGYYRRDYGQNDHRDDATAGSSYSVAASSPSPRTEPRRLQTNQQPIVYLRLVTILIEDKRGDEVENQLAEVRVTLRDSEDVKVDGYWAQAKDICQTLQASPSRIDGPAKVSAWRGKYRQIILKVTADNQDEYVEANVVVDPLRTLQVIVESGLPAAARFNPPPIPRAIPEADPYMSGPQYNTYMATSPANQEHNSRKRRHSPSDDYRGRSNSRQWSPSTLASSPRATPSRPSTSHQQNAFNAGSSEPRMHFTGQHSLPGPSRNDRYSPVPYASLNSPYKNQSHSASDDSFSSESEDADAIHDRVSQELDPILQKDHPAWDEYFRWTAKPPSAAAMLGQYRSVQGFVDRWVGKTLPSGAVIEKSHIAQALVIDGNAAEREKYMAECTETLHLMGLYGPDGQRLQDPDVVAKATDDSPPGYNTKPIRSLLKLLRKVDQQWAHPAT